MGLNKINVAIDGPAAAGKSTVAKKIAEKLNFIYVDTGAMYRALTLKALQQGIDVNNEEALLKLIKQTEIELSQSTKDQRVFLDGHDVSHDIRTKEVSNHVAHVAKHPSVRNEMLKRQQELAKKSSVVMDGRDIGTHVLPSAEVKIFLIASVDKRAKRRHEENIKKGFPSNLAELKKEIEQRDEEDMKRKTAPLVKAKDAKEIDTTELTIDEVVNKILAEINLFCKK